MSTRMKLFLCAKHEIDSIIFSKPEEHYNYEKNEETAIDLHKIIYIIIILARLMSL